MKSIHRLDDPAAKYSRIIYLVEYKAERYIMKTVICPITLKEEIKNAKTEFELNKKLSDESPLVCKAIEMQELTDAAGGTNYLEMLYEYGGEDLSKLAGKLNTEEILDLARDTLEAFAFLGEKNIFHSDIKPENIVRNSAGQIKVIDFGASKEFDKRANLMKTTKTLSGKMSAYTERYSPPEIFYQSGHYIIGKIDTYCWAMTIYQLLTG